MPLVRIPLFSVILMVAHGWLFRPWKSLFLVLIPVVLAAVPADLEGVSDNRDRQFVLAKTFSVAIILEFGTAVCVAYAPQQAAWPLSGFVYRCCAYLKGYHWPWMFLYLGPRVGPYSPYFGFGFPYKPLKTKKGTLFLPRLLLGLGTWACARTSWRPYCSTWQTRTTRTHIPPWELWFFLFLKDLRRY